MEEFIDILDENGNKTGKTASRREVHEKGLWHRGAVITIIDKANKKILMQQRSKTVETFPECWDVSAAGHVSAGQSSIEAAVRELGEEINVQAKKEDLKKLVQFKEGTKINDKCIENLFFDCYLLECNNLNLDDIKLQESEVQQIKLCSIDEVMELVKAKKVLPRDRLYSELLQYFRDINKSDEELER